MARLVNELIIFPSLVLELSIFSLSFTCLVRIVDCLMVGLFKQLDNQLIYNQKWELIRLAIFCDSLGIVEDLAFSFH